MNKPYRIMFVCLGNICRSPMAELLLKDMVKKAGREGDFIIESSATAHDNVWNGVGAPVYSHIKTLLEGKGISCAGKRAQVLTAEHGDKFDLFLCMDDSNVRNASRILGEKNAQKCKKLLSYAGESGNVADPWYTRDFEQAYNDVKRGLEGLLTALD
jgi:protein-tyrosine phosphatase